MNNLYIEIVLIIRLVHSYLIHFLSGSNKFNNLSAYTRFEAVNKITSNNWDTRSRNSRKNGRVRTNTVYLQSCTLTIYK